MFEKIKEWWWKRRYDKSWKIYPACDDYSLVVNELLDKMNPTIGTDKKETGELYTIRLGGLEIWVANRFYSFGRLYCNIDGLSDVMLNAPTTLRLWKIVEEMENENMEKVRKRRIEQIRRVGFNCPQGDMKDE